MLAGPAFCLNLGAAGSLARLIMPSAKSTVGHMPGVTRVN